MKKIIFIASSCLVLFATGCKKSGQNTVSNESVKDSVAVAEKTQEVPLDHIVVVAGQEVPINENMSKYIKELQSKVANVQEGTEVDYTKLQADLNESLKHLISSCTLGGTKYHETLHKYLFPVKENIEQLDTKKAEGLKVIKENLSQLECK